MLIGKHDFFLQWKTEFIRLRKIQQNGSTILAFEKHKYERENNLTNDRLHLETLHENACNARLDFQKI